MAFAIRCCLCGHMMPEQSIIVWDLETVPDLTAAARMRSTW